MIEVPSEFKPIINTVYPPDNHLEFERWFDIVFNEQLEREYIGIYWCGYQVNNNYGNDIEAMKRLQSFIDSLPRDKKYFTISQYDDGVGVDFKDLDVLQFNMSKNIGITMPLMCQPHPYSFDEIRRKKYLANFIGKNTHPIRQHANNLQGLMDYYISFNDHPIGDYCKVIHDSMFTLCFRGYGCNSFRVSEALQFGSIPVVITDEFINPFDLDFSEFGILIRDYEANDINKILKSYTPLQLTDMQYKGIEVYEKYYTYNGAYNKILEYLK